MIKLLELRNEKNLSQRAVAERFFVSQATFNNWENGKTQPSITQLIALANFFDVTVDYLIGASDERENEYYSLSAKERTFLNSFRNADEKKQDAMLILLENAK